jgi:hypothetical protein
MSDELNMEAERAAFEAWMKSRPGYPFAGAFANLMWDAWQAARRTAPVAPMGQELPPLPQALDEVEVHSPIVADLPKYTERKVMRSWCDYYTAEQMVEYASKHVAPYAERIRQLERELAERKTASIDSDPKFSEVLAKFLDEAEASNISGYDMARYQRARAALIAYIDGRTAGAALPEHLREFVEAVATDYHGTDNQERLLCYGCNADIDDNGPHEPHCIVLRARAMIAGVRQLSEEIK